MSTRVTIRLVGVAVVMALAASVAVGYIHFPPLTMQKMCKQATNIRVLSVKKHDKDKGVVVYEVVETLKGENPRGDGANSIALAIDGRVYQESYKGDWWSYSLEARKKGISGYQFRAPEVVR